MVGYPLKIAYELDQRSVYLKPYPSRQETYPKRDPYSRNKVQGSTTDSIKQSKRESGQNRGKKQPSSDDDIPTSCTLAYLE
jgi:hypothetical protein